jgi:hypothetical protein
MSEHERTITVNVSANDAFQYLSSVSNLPDYLPLLSKVEEDEDEHVSGMADLGEGRWREVSGFFRPDESTLTINWESDGTPGYRGRMDITPESANRSRITVHISMLGAAAETPPPHPALGSDRIERMFDSVMRSVEDALERNVQTRSAA